MAKNRTFPDICGHLTSDFARLGVDASIAKEQSPPFFCWRCAPLIESAQRGRNFRRGALNLDTTNKTFTGTTSVSTAPVLNANAGRLIIDGNFIAAVQTNVGAAGTLTYGGTLALRRRH